MMAAIYAGQRGKTVLLLEKTNRLGKKLLITGNGRCNITNSAPVEELIAQIPGNGRFLYSAFYAFDNDAVIDFFHGNGVLTKEERGGRIFPQSDRSRDVVECLTHAMRSAGVKVYTDCAVTSLTRGAEGFVVSTGQQQYSAAKVIVATGGASCPRTGSTGDAYQWARALGHTVTPILPALVPLTSKEQWVQSLQGLSLKNVTLTAFRGKRNLGREFGEMLFTHYGVSGPIVLTLSRAVAKALHQSKDPVTLQLNLKPALTHQQLDRRLVREFEALARKQFKNALDDLLPKMLIPVIIDLSGISPEKPVHQITQQERNKLVSLLHRLPITVTGTRPLAEAIVTNGGVSVKEVDPSTMESKLVPGLYFAGEVLDLDGVTGGYNLQVAWSTGYAAAVSV